MTLLKSLTTNILTRSVIKMWSGYFSASTLAMEMA